MKRIGLIALGALLAGCSGSTSGTGSSPESTAPGGSQSASASGSVAGAGQIVVADDDVSLKLEHDQLYLEGGDGSNLHRLVTSKDHDNHPVLSPDGRRVAFDRQYPDEPNRPSVTFVVGIDGSGLRQVDPAGCTGLCVADDLEGDGWSPDGRQLVLTRVYADAAGAIASIGLWLVDVDGTGATQVTEHQMAEGIEDHAGGWSPDGKRLVFVRLDSSVTPARSAVFTIGIDGSDARQVTPWELNAGGPAWSPDGTLIAFQSPGEAYEQPGEQNIFVIRPDGTGLTQLTAHTSVDAKGRQANLRASWSPDGTQIVFSHRPASNGNGDLFVMNRDGSDLHPLASTPLNEQGPDWGVSHQAGT